LHDEGLLRRWERLFALRDQVKKALERTPAPDGGNFGGGSSLRAKVVLTGSGEELNFLCGHVKELPFIFIVSQIEIVRAEEGELKVEVEPAEGRKCDRCWNITTTVGSSERFPTVCARCAVNIEEGWGDEL
jgi:isoleucyl-tRNA synthetase